MTLRRPLRAVIDTNVLLDFWVFDDPATRALREAIEGGRVTALRCRSLIDELVDVLMRPVFEMSTDRRDEIVRLWNEATEVVESVAPSTLACSDRTDQKFLDLAFSAQADWLVTKDKALLKLRRQAGSRGLAILQPLETVARLNQTSVTPD